MAQYDAVSKHIVQTYAEDVIYFAFGRAGIEVIEVLETEQPTVEARRTDSLLRVRIDEKEALVHCEFQTADSTAVPSVVYIRPLPGAISTCRV